MDGSSPPTRPISVREDCWSEEATSTLVDAWGRRYMELSRGNLRQKDWQEVADFVNARHGHSKKTFRTDVQCKNRVDTVKKKFKTEKARVTASNGVLVSNWCFYDRLDALIGPNVMKLASSGSGQVGMSISPHMALLVYRKSEYSAPSMATVTPVMLPKKRPAQNDDSYFRKNYSVAAAAAAAASMEVDEGDQGEEDERTEEDEEESERSMSSGEKDEELDGNVDGIKKLAKAIQRFGEIYARVEGEKQKQMVELEKQRMQFAKELEVQRMQMFMNTQVQLEKIKRIKGSGSNGEISSLLGLCFFNLYSI